MSATILPWYVRIKREHRDKYRQLLAPFGDVTGWYAAENTADPQYVELALWRGADMTAIVPPIPITDIEATDSPAFTKEGGNVQYRLTDDAVSRIVRGEMPWIVERELLIEEVWVSSVYAGSIKVCITSESLPSNEVPIHFLVPVDPEFVANLVHPVILDESLKVLSLTGRCIRITKASRSDLGTICDHADRALAWMKEFGCIEVQVLASRISMGPSEIRVGRHFVSLAAIKYTVVPPEEELRIGDRVVFKSATLVSVPGRCDYHNNRMVCKVASLDCKWIGVNHPLETGDVYGHVMRNEVRRLTPEEAAFANETLSPKPASIEDVGAAFGPTMIDVMRLYPTAVATRGLVFARTDVALSEADDTFEKIMATLCKNSGRLLLSDTSTPVLLPKDMASRGHRAYLESLGLSKEIVKEKTANPLDALGDDDLVEVRISASRRETRVADQRRTFEWNGSVRIPASVVREGSESVIRCISRGEASLPSPNNADPDWEDTDYSDEDADSMVVHQLDFGPLSQFVDQGPDRDPSF